MNDCYIVLHQVTFNHDNIQIKITMKVILSAYIMMVMIQANLCFGQAFPDRHSTNLNDGWLSCQASANPNPARGTGHWIRYNLGDTYALTQSTIWNFNTPERVNSYNNQPWSLAPLQGKLTDGLKDVVIDLSINGIDWQEWGRFTIPIAPGSSFYEGSFGPDFGGKLARHILITAVSNHGGSCYGLGEVRFNGTIATVSSTLDPLADASISASPNPFRNQTLIKLEKFPQGEARFTLMDVVGKELISSTIVVRGEVEEFPLDGNDLTSGLYFLKITQKDAVKTLKLEVIK